MLLVLPMPGARLAWSANMATAAQVDPAARLQTYRELASQFRADSIRATTEAGSGHPTSSMSAADLMAVLLASHLRYDPEEPRALGNDRLIFSKGHAAPLLYAVLKAAGAISDAALMTLRKMGSPLEGHPAPVLPYVEVATGSLGQGLAMAVGMALVAKRLDRSPSRFWVLLGDSEMAEGSIYESFEAGAFYGLSSVVAILDMNRLGQRGPTMLGWDGEAYAARARAFAWEARVIDGHDPAAIDAAYSFAEQAGKPTLIVARTKKGAGVSFLEDKEGWHGKALSRDEANRALAELGWGGRVPSRVVRPARPARVVTRASEGSKLELPRYEPGANVATRAAFGDALAALGASNPRVVVLDGEVSNSTYTDRFAKAHPARFFEMYIAEQQMVSRRRRDAGARMDAVRRHVRGVLHARLRSGSDGLDLPAPRQPRRLPRRRLHRRGRAFADGPRGSRHDARRARQRRSLSLLCATRRPSSWRRWPRAAASNTCARRGRRRRCSIRPDEAFPIGGSKVLRRSDRDRVAVIAAGITVHEALKAYETLRVHGVQARIIDLYSVKPVDRATLQEAARDCDAGLLVVEDHHPEGGLADAVAEAFEGMPAPAIRRLAVAMMPGIGYTRPADRRRRHRRGRDRRACRLDAGTRTPLRSRPDPAA